MVRGARDVRRAVRRGARRVRRQLRPGPGRRRLGRRGPSTASWSSTSGAATPTRPGTEPVGARHDHQRLVDDQDDDGAVRADARRPRRARRRTRPSPATGPSSPPTARRASLVRHLLGAHRRPVGLGGADRRSTTSTTGRSAPALLAAQAPWWEPGTASGYHAITQGYLVGEVVRRVTGESLGTFFAKEVAGPLGADFHIGLPPEARRPGRQRDPAAAAADPTASTPSSVASRTFANPPLDAEHSWTEPWRRAEIPAANGHGNARSVATVQSAVASGGEVGGVRLLSPAGCDAIFEEQSHGIDLVLGIPLRFGIGYGLNRRRMPDRPEPAHLLLGRLGRLDRRQRPRRQRLTSPT